MFYFQQLKSPHILWSFNCYCIGAYKLLRDFPCHLRHLQSHISDYVKLRIFILVLSTVQKIVFSHTNVAMTRITTTCCKFNYKNFTKFIGLLPILHIRGWATYGYHAPPSPHLNETKFFWSPGIYWTRNRMLTLKMWGCKPYFDDLSRGTLNILLTTSRNFI